MIDDYCVLRVHSERGDSSYDDGLNPLNTELNPICYLLALLGAHHFLHVSRIGVKSLSFRLLKSYIYGAPILDVSRSHTTTQHSRQDSSGRVISPSQRPLPDNTRHSQQINIHALGGIRIHDLRRREAADLPLRPRSHWDWPKTSNKYGNYFIVLHFISFLLCYLYSSIVI